MNRRTFLKTTVAATGAGLAVGPASAGTTTDLEEIDERFDHVKTEYDEELLRTYQPRLIMDGESRPKFRHFLSWVARSDQYETTACCYIARYVTQKGYFGPIDSHLYDTEPVYVFIHEDTQEVDEVVFTGWHWNAAAVSGERAPLSASRTGAETHISLQVISPWHHYTLPFEADTGAFFGLEDWHSRREYLVNGALYETGAPEAFEDPWTMHSAHGNRPGWWQKLLLKPSDGWLPYQLNTDYLIMRSWAYLGFRGYGDRAEELR